MDLLQSSVLALATMFQALSPHLLLPPHTLTILNQHTITTTTTTIATNHRQQQTEVLPAILPGGKELLHPHQDMAALFPQILQVVKSSPTCTITITRVPHPPPLLLPVAAMRLYLLPRAQDHTTNQNNLPPSCSSSNTKHTHSNFSSYSSCSS